MRMPTAVAVQANGDVLVLDGAHNRVVVFGPDGGLRKILDTFDGRPLKQPVGLRVDSKDRIWIADSGAARIVVAGPDGVFEQSIELPAASDGRAADPTDVGFAPDGGLWVVDNNNHRLLRRQPQGIQWEVFGQLGEALGQFEFPFELAIASDGDMFVTDVINARVQTFNAAGQAMRGIGEYGLDRGQLYRPGGIALDSKQNLWVADSVLGCVQVFRRDGSLIDALRDESGEVLRLSHPMGLAFDQAGALYVVECRADQVRKFTLRPADSGTPQPVLASRARRDEGEHAKGCTICHIEWLPPFSSGRDSELMHLPTTSPEQPLASRESTCLTCHDGTVSDSRHKVWEMHGHRTGVIPPDNIKVPPNLPLVEGKLACRTCHSAHGGAAPQGDIRKSVLLRVPNPSGELCVSCHTDKARGPRFGTHPTGGMPWPIPEKLLQAGSKAGPTLRELTCMVCHTPHGASYDHLLVLGVGSNELCVSCHDQMRPGTFRDGARAEHPLTAIMNDEQLAAVTALGTRSGEGGRLVCLSCHKLHHGQGDRFLLAAPLADGQMCLTCHSERREMLGSSHDLRTNFPQERNRLGMSAEQGGPCSACHLFHRFARQTFPAIGDADGFCTSCHREGECAENKKLGPVNHVSVRCIECHNPHNVRTGKFLKATPDELCSTCHSDKWLMTGGGHDSSRSPAEWCMSGDRGGSRCLACHRPHGDEQTKFWRVPPTDTAAGEDAPCLACHTDVHWKSGSKAAMHPSAAITAEKAGPLPLSHNQNGETRVGCRTCHDPHAPPTKAGKLLRVGMAESAEKLCIGCHSNAASILETAHSSEHMQARGIDAHACAPCHNAHGSPDQIAGHLLWSNDRTATINPEDRTVADVLCSECHRNQGDAPLPAAATHPAVAFFNPRESGGLPLFNPVGVPDAAGQISCRTCHVPHGREAEPSNPAELARATRPLVRPFDSPNACTMCHGIDSLRRFLYFHDPDQRTAQARGE
ncbi:MAG: SMP-30/gluconolactonase/LRE family protein [Planctomycetes bacterium]|nr:SMP-30/gluconolactonase/LRE family protein [Planctomycetota bacterium]